MVVNRCMKIEYARLFGGLGLIGVNTKVISVLFNFNCSATTT